ncbi:ATP-dependent Clp protease proteolytic subunit [Demequina sp. B12]|uniref:SDH family Clp fold serine proteinase n=1 Tax=Demequina sp. B12 TaxID=2992757 RepID=UPI00237BB252|nr:ATP-dependent Clp protease proteolytic subunit [Demequina sp. B12]MDE0571804.1 ATP-dependent Clp protease proteolytic subunit [Demequina sp. B12]
MSEVLGGASKTHLFAAQHAGRYDRQKIIRDYQEATGAQLIVMIDQVFNHGVTLLEELLVGSDPEQELHLMLSSPGGDGEVAVRLVRAMQSRCSKLTIIIPDMAKSAATIMCLGANEILMSPSSDLGPVDPQFPIGGRLVGAKDIEQALEDAEKRVAAAPETFPLYAGLLADVNMLMIEQARSAMARSYTLIEEALECSEMSADDRTAVVGKLRGPLIDEAHYHGATIGPQAARNLGLPVTVAETSSAEWQLIWALWTRYFQLGAWPAGPMSVYESAIASQVFGPGPSDGPA